MYSKYDEMRVMRQVMQNYADNQKMQYESNITMLKNQINNLTTDINGTAVSFLQNRIASMSNYQTEYQKALAIVKEFDKAIMCFEEGLTQENIRDGLDKERAKEGIRIFREIQSQNAEYKRIIAEIAYGLFTSHDPHIEDLGTDLDAKLDNLDNEFEAGSLSKEQLIYYNNMCYALSQDPDYIEYMSQFNQEQSQSGMHR